MFLQKFLDYFQIITSIIGVFSMIAAATPNKTDDSIVAFISKIINLLAFNFGKASNEKHEDK